MKAVATGFLLAAVGLYVLARWQEGHGAGWAQYLGAAAQAAMVGALADWFAVTALFRRPLGLPIPHTAIIPHRKEALGRSLGDFVGENFLSEQVIRVRLRAVRLSDRLGGWLAQEKHADRVTHEAAGVLRGVLAVLRDDDLQAVLSRTLNRWLSEQPVGQVAGRVLARFVADDGHRPLVDLLARRAVTWLEEHPDAIERTVTGEAPMWTPRFVDERVARRIHKELVRFAAAVRDEPDHKARAAIDDFLADFAVQLATDPATLAQAERFKQNLINHHEVQRLVGSSWQALRSLIVSAAEDADSELRVRARAAIAGFGRRLAEDDRLRNKMDAWVEDAAVYLVTTYRAEITALITETVGAWDAQETSRKVEIQVGRDLQFIRINGTVVGALAGLLIYVLTRFG
ncbi:DUF445 domain-containing protein [Actinocrinis puniceicyclus]|uniref:DUF445 domain-containing protein n=2 Tax=Actinocrinis puniceicyclus TaxID=977794 RepID=A0A8J8BE77_9ACTN|nr:DUF445 domain-containing protein [Actinocrinis puniceicyclus]